ncbi:alpha/beta hydrolase [Microbulbifer sp. ANSA002]|uniref:alpha/beta hydrolase n=1 Tax=unclassified Microbulbifer TaxID=2619833 RepID=UPI0040420CBE
MLGVNSLRTAVAILSVLLLAPVITAKELSNTQECYLDGWRHPLRCERISVGHGDSKVNLVVFVSPALDETQREPLYLLAGGPGQAASGLIPLLHTFRKINQKRAIVMVDRRGTGHSRSFGCGIDRHTPMDLSLISKELEQCYLQQANFANSLSSRQAVEDLEKVRKYFNHKQISLWGGSWGTRTALLYQQWHPNSLKTLVLDAVAPIDTKVFLSAAAAEDAIQILMRDCSLEFSCSKFGNWREVLDKLLSQWDESKSMDFPDPVTGKPMKHSMSRWVLQNTIRAALYSPEAAAQLPFAIQQAGLGNHYPLAGITGLFPESALGMSLGLTLSIACAEELSRISEEEILADTNGSFAGNAFLEIFERGCEVWPVADRSYAKPQHREHPVLLISGEADPITPPRYAEKQLGYLTNKQHLIITSGGHINSMRGCVPRLIEEFLDSSGEELATTCVDEIHRPPFVSGIYGPEIMQGVTTTTASGKLGENAP